MSVRFAAFWSSSFVVLLTLMAAGTARADTDDLREWDRPYGIVKAGIGLPGLPGVAAEIFLRDRLTIQAEGGTGLIGAYGAVSVRYRPCLGCDRWGPAIALGVGPELTVVPFGEDERTAILPTLTVEPAFSFRFHERFGLVLGVKFGVGYEWDFKDGGYYGSDIANIFGINLGAQF